MKISNKYNISNIEAFLKDNGITNMDFKLEEKIIKISGYITKTGPIFDDFYEMMKEKFGKRFNFVGWNEDIAEFEVKI